MSFCPLNQPCENSKTVQLIIMQGKEEETVTVCEKCPLAKQMTSLETNNNSCCRCGSKLKDLAKDKRLGCEYCYLFMSRQLKTLIDKVQDGNTKHTGKKPTDKTKLLQQFFNQIIQEYAEKNQKDVKTCEKLQKLLARYF
jgi:protein-arginine kinase activator protein McsA